jgi:hypothetical protein
VHIYPRLYGATAMTTGRYLNGRKDDFIAYRVGHFEMKLVVASSQRDWMDQTDRGFANRCLPMLMANQAGWTVLNDRPLRAMWIGSSGLDSVVIEPTGDPPYAALSHFGHGILTFTLPFLFRTPPGTALLVRGPANTPKDAISALEGLVETEWSVATATMNWKFTRANTWVEFARGEPLCMVVPQRFDALENMFPRVLDAKQDLDTYDRYQAWKQSRGRFIENLRKLDPNTVKQAWQRHYFQGTAPPVESNPPTSASRHRTRLKLREFLDEGPPFVVSTRETEEQIQPQYELQIASAKEVSQRRAKRNRTNKRNTDKDKSTCTNYLDEKRF